MKTTALKKYESPKMKVAALAQENLLAASNNVSVERFSIKDWDEGETIEGGEATEE